MKNSYYIKNNVAYVLDSKGNTFIVDADDLERIKICTWCKDNAKGYVMGTIKRKRVPLHRFLLGYPDGIVDHINRNTCDNRRKNLRVCNITESNWNRGVQRSNRVGIKGVALCLSRDRKKKYRAQINVNGKRIRLGWFMTAEEAAIAYKEAERKYYGEFAPVCAPDE